MACATQYSLENAVMATPRLIDRAGVCVFDAKLEVQLLLTGQSVSQSVQGEVSVTCELASCRLE